MCGFAFCFTTLRCDAYMRDHVMTFQTQPQKLHTSTTFPHHCCHKITRALKIKRTISPERRVVCIFHMFFYSAFNLTTQNHVANFCNKQPGDIISFYFIKMASVWLWGCLICVLHYTGLRLYLSPLWVCVHVSSSVHLTAFWNRCLFYLCCDIIYYVGGV